MATSRAREWRNSFPDSSRSLTRELKILRTWGYTTPALFQGDHHHPQPITTSPSLIPLKEARVKKIHSVVEELRIYTSVSLSGSRQSPVLQAYGHPHIVDRGSMWSLNVTIAFHNKWDHDRLAKDILVRYVRLPTTPSRQIRRQPVSHSYVHNLHITSKLTNGSNVREHSVFPDDHNAMQPGRSGADLALGSECC